MANRQRNLGINIRVTPEEKEKIERNAKKDSFLRINEVIGAVSDMKRRSSDPITQKFCDDIYADLLRIMVETLQLMRHIYPKTEVNTDGND